MTPRPPITANVPARTLSQRLVVAVRDQAIGKQIRQAARALGVRCDELDVVPLAAAAGRVVEVAPHAILIVCDANDPEALEAIQAVHKITGAPIQACGDDTDALLIRDTIQNGASGFLSLERIDQELSGCLAATPAEVEVPVEDRSGKVLGFFSASGGVGLSTAAVNLAAELAADVHNRVALVEMRPAPGDLAILLDIDPTHTTDDLLKRGGQLDERMLSAACIPHRKGMSVLAQIPFDGHSSIAESHWSAEAASRLVRILRRVHTHVILDLDHDLDDVRRNLLAACDFAGLVVRPDVPSVRRAGWFLTRAVQGGLRRSRFTAILSRCGENSGLSSAHVQETLDIPVIQSIPEDVKSFQRAVNEGITFAEVSRNSPIRRSISSLAHSICNQR
jgi:Flp pilus assembly CpaE family ATPase